MAYINSKTFNDNEARVVSLIILNKNHIISGRDDKTIQISKYQIARGNYDSSIKIWDCS